MPSPISHPIFPILPPLMHLQRDCPNTAECRTIYGRFALRQFAPKTFHPLVSKWASSFLIQHGIRTMSHVTWIVKNPNDGDRFWIRWIRIGRNVLGRNVQGANWRRGETSSYLQIDARGSIVAVNFNTSHDAPWQPMGVLYRKMA